MHLPRRNPDDDGSAPDGVRLNVVNRSVPPVRAAGEAVVRAASPLIRNPSSAVPCIAAVRASVGGGTKRRLDGEYREYAHRLRMAPTAAKQPPRSCVERLPQVPFSRPYGWTTPNPRGPGEALVLSLPSQPQPERTFARYRSAASCVMAPGRPLPITRPSIFTTGVTPPRVPVTKASSAL